MSEDRSRVPPHLAAQLVEHLERLAREGVWGLPRTEAPVPSEPPRDEDRQWRDRLVAELRGDGSGDLFAEPEAPSRPSAGRSGESLAEIEAEALDCTACRLCEERNRVVFGVGDPNAEILFIGEAPGRDEDRLGEPFVGRAGKLLDRIIEAMGMKREAVYIANANKCRPPNNRNPMPDEIAACRPFLLRQVAAIRPRVIVLLGRVATISVLGLDRPLSKLRGEVHDFQGVPTYCTYHPAYLLRNPAAKKPVWDDMKRVLAFLGRGV
jgi:DNA polymerase